MKFYSHSHSVFKYMVLKSFVEVVLKLTMNQKTFYKSVMS